MDRKLYEDKLDQIYDNSNLKENKIINYYFDEESERDLVEENRRYTFNGVVLDSASKVARDLTAIRVHMIDFGVDEFDIDTYSYIKEEIERCRNDLDEGKVTEAAVRVVCMQLLLGFSMDMITIVKGIINDKISLPKEFFGEVPQKMLMEIITGSDEDCKRLSIAFNGNSGPGEGILRKRSGK